MSGHIVVTGMGAVSSVGIGCSELWSAVSEGRDGLRTFERFSTADLTTHIGGVVPSFDKTNLSYRQLCIEFAVQAAVEAMNQASIVDAQVPNERVALVLGVRAPELLMEPREITEAVGDRLQLCGMRLSIVTACSSSAAAIGLGRELIQMGAADLVLAGGTDVLSPELMAGFNALGVLSYEKCAPFSQTEGTTLSEGAGIVVLEEQSSASRRDVAPLAALLGFGMSGDAYHETSPTPTGAGLARAMTAALGDAGVSASSIGYINSHGTGTVANDRSEWNAVVSMVGEQVPISATKSLIGHAQCAAGVLEFIVSIMAMSRGVVPPTVNSTGARPHCPTDAVNDTAPRPHEYNMAFANNAAFGGSNTSLVVASPNAQVQLPKRSKRAVKVLGVGVVGSFGLGIDALEQALRKGDPLERCVPPFSIEKRVRHANPAGLNPMTRFLTTAASDALTNSAIRVRGSLRNRAGLIVGVNGVSETSSHRFHESIRQRGLARLSSVAFTQMVPNATAGKCTMLLSLRGPQTVLTTGAGGGLAAIISASRWLSARSDADLIVAGGVDEKRELIAPEDSEGAGCLCLAHEDYEGEAAAYVAGWGLAGPGDIATASHSALSMAGLAEEELDEVLGDHLEDFGQILGFAPASLSVICAALAVHRVKQGQIERAMVISSVGASLTAAIIFTRKAPG